MEQSRSRYASWIALVLSALLLAAVMMLCISQNQAQAVEAAPDAQATQVFTGTITAGDQEAALPAASATPAKKAGKASKYALLEKNGKVYPCNKKGKKLSATWKGGTTFNYLMVAPNVTKIPKQFNYKYVGFSGVKMKLKSVTFMLKGGKNACKTIVANNPLGDQTALKTLKNFNKTKVTSIGKYGLAGTGITSITLPKTLTKLGEGAFAYCKKLTKVVFPASLKSVGKNAFRGDAKLKTLSKFGKTKVTSIGMDAFGETGITAIALPKTLKTIGVEAFAATKKLKTVSGLASTKVTAIGKAAFYESGVTTLALPASCKSIGYAAFCDCAALNSLSMPSATLVTGSGDMLTGTVMQNNPASATIKVPAALADQYKAATYWSDYADCITS
ncbi:MAG: leucine-rich repeat domain-containing protein [Coriobacteriia bacterium]|nr:leucine-rich repeat domain-containing protein [Coriobacteriia bacterium]